MEQEFLGEEKLLSMTELMRQVYPASELGDSSFLRWKYLQSPHGPPVIHHAEDSQGWTATYQVLPRTFVVEGVDRVGCLSVDTATRKDVRGQGLFQRLANATYDELPAWGIDFTIGFPNNQSLPVFSGPLGFSLMGNVPFLLKPLRPWSLLKRLVRKKDGRKGSDLTFNIDPSSVFRNKQWKSTPLDWNSDLSLLQPLFDSMNVRHRCAMKRSIEYFKWRYGSCPSRNYTLMIVQENNSDEVLGYIVLRAVQLMGFRCGVVVDLGCCNAELAAQALGFQLHVAFRKFKEAGIELVVAACMDGCLESEQLYLEGCFALPGFMMPQPLRLILKVHRQEEINPTLLQFENWFLTFGDYDVL